MPYDFSTFDRNCAKEQATPISGSVTGSIPSWLRGSLVLNGPGKMKFGDQEYLHVLDGASILQKVDFTETGPTYSSKFLRSSAFLVNSENDQIVVSELGTKGTSVSNKTAFQKLGEKFSLDKLFSDNAQLNVVRYGGGGYYAITESPFIHKICIKTLETIRKVDLNKEFGVNSQCPHPIQLKDGSSINVFHNVGATGPKYEIYKFPAQDSPDSFPKPTKIASVDARWKLNPCLMHSFGVTEHYFVLPEQPLTFDVKAMVANSVKEKPFIDGMEWIKDKLVKFHVVCRETGKELKFRLKSEAFFYLHIINCYEENNFIVVDLCAFEKPDILYAFFVKNIRENGQNMWKELDRGTIKRIVLPLSVNDKVAPEENLITLGSSKATAYRQKDGVVVLTPEEISPICYENPTMNPNFIGRKYSCFFGASSDMDDYCGKVAKVDVRSGEVKLWSKDGVYTCVLQFVPRPGAPADAEDDGVLLVTCLHGGQERSKFSVAVLDASSFNELAFATFNTPSDAPRALHGNFIQE